MSELTAYVAVMVGLLIGGTVSLWREHRRRLELNTPLLPQKRSAWGKAK